MSKLLALALGAALVAAPAFAADSDDQATGPLPAGDAAGAQQASLTGGAAFWLAGAGLIAAALAIPLSSGGHSSTTTTTAGH